jgi:malonate transporter and related proteins
MSKTPFAELNNPPFLIATTLGTASAFALALVAGRLVGRLSFREGTLAGLAELIGTFASVITFTSVMWFIQTGRLVFP